MKILYAFLIVAVTTAPAMAQGFGYRSSNYRSRGYSTRAPRQAYQSRYRYRDTGTFTGHDSRGNYIYGNHLGNGLSTGYDLKGNYYYFQNFND